MDFNLLPFIKDLLSKTRADWFFVLFLYESSELGMLLHAVVKVNAELVWMHVDCSVVVPEVGVQLDSNRF